MVFTRVDIQHYAEQVATHEVMPYDGPIRLNINGLSLEVLIAPGLDALRSALSAMGMVASDVSDHVTRLGHVLVGVTCGASEHAGSLNLNVRHLGAGRYAASAVVTSCFSNVPELGAALLTAIGNLSQYDGYHS